MNITLRSIVITLYPIFTLTLCFSLSLNAQNPQANKTTKPVVVISSFSLCGTSVTELKKDYADLHEVAVEEMDFSSRCEPLDSRYVAKKGYATSKQPGLIFQQGKNGDLIGKIRLTTDYKGVFTDGKDINVSQLKAKDVFERFPALKGKWGSRDCSDYWNISNDTISFFVKIDRAKKPLYPIDEAYYLEQPVVGIDLVLSCFVSSGEHVNLVETTNDPVFIIDSLRMFRDEMQIVDPNTIAAVTVYKDKNATDRFGPEAENGLIYIETKAFVRKRYWTLLSTKSKEYLKLVSAPGKEDEVVYILNGKPLLKNHEGDLAGLNATIFEGLSVIDKATLKKEYQVEGYLWGIVIKTRK
ncbi:hypothetical protein [Pedobacter ginsengisoli]|uniref:hypothetical protein n=1 Tax=Pedobacter ginsengisoli TaxID=363852 RepID=UPI00254AB4E0|nr:hypothetical protein [Pedobacter ginsengisoli]